MSAAREDSRVTVARQALAEYESLTVGTLNHGTTVWRYLTADL